MISLKSKITRKLLNYFFLNPKESLYVNELSRNLALDKRNLVKKIKELETEVPEILDYIDTPNYILSVAALLQDKIPSQKGYHSLDLEKMISDWEKVTVGTKELVALLEEQSVFDNERLPTETILAPIAAILALYVAIWSNFFCGSS